ncbi:sodium- and chloride-dependent glycine transporter 2-like [Pollicipes pollicipes]|uniref:sodium- and chloride-dependent glycine transporter 2-like n=1 Tax=Pollicipes pollicipes TaxID=41117 RepID=UPI001884F60D|nr:sodium- and chloride-dependent glycine transporter 2-like [Pollicipes pollicipes]
MGVDNPKISGRPIPDSSVENLFEGDENPERGNWTGKLDFLLSCLGYAVGLGNVWRFPYLCYQNGGGAFLVPYCIMLFCLGIPIFLLELNIGQFSAMAPITLFKHYAPGFRGLGVAMFLASVAVGLYYNMIIAWTIYYTYSSMTADLPWQYCDHDFNTPNCFSKTAYERCSAENNGTWWIYNFGRCITNQTEAQELNVTETVPKDLRVSPSEEFLERHVLNLSDGIDEVGGIQWGLFISLLIAWVVVGAALIKGVKSSGKVVYFTALFPYVVLIILLVRGATLPGAYDGIYFYMVPEFDKLSDIKIWESAAVQIFYSLSIASGGLITLASYNKFHNNVLRDTLIVCFGNCCTSVFAGFAIFSVLGFMAHELNLPVSEVVNSGSGLAFVAYPDLVTRLPVSTLWALLFFLMLFTLGLDSQFAIIENIITCILDEFPRLRPKKPLVVITVCLVLFLMGIPLTTQCGRYVIDLLDNYAAGLPYLFIGLMELLAMYWVYGVGNFYRDLMTIQGFSPGLRLKSHITVIYGTIAPLLLAGIIAFSVEGAKPLVSGDYTYPVWANMVGWAIAIFIMAMVPLGFLVDVIFFQKGNILKSFRATDEWYRHSENIAHREKNAQTRAGFDNLAIDNNQFYEYNSRL